MVVAMCRTDVAPFRSTLRAQEAAVSRHLVVMEKDESDGRTAVIVDVGPQPRRRSKRKADAALLKWLPAWLLLRVWQSAVCSPCVLLAIVVLTEPLPSNSPRLPLVFVSQRLASSRSCRTTALRSSRSRRSRAPPSALLRSSSSPPRTCSACSRARTKRAFTALSCVTMVG